MDHKGLLERYALVSDQVDKGELTVVLSELEKLLQSEASGSVVEFGCYAGTTSLFVRRLLDIYNDEREFHVYDSFEGLPEKSDHDRSPTGEQFRAGELAVSKKEFIQHFRKAHLKLPIIHKGWFDVLGASDVPEEITFAFLDGDYYDSVLIPLQLMEGKLRQGAVIIVDDYGNLALPGARRAVDEWRNKHQHMISAFHEQQSLAIIKLK